MDEQVSIDNLYVGYAAEGHSQPTGKKEARTANHLDFKVAPQPDKPELSTWGDDTLMEHIARGNTHAFEELYDRYVRGCFGLAMKIVREPTMAEEVVQDVFMKLWSRPGIFSSDRGKFSGWLLTLVHNRSVDKLRRLKAGGAGPVLPLDGTLDSDLNLADVLADTAATPYDQAWTEEQGRIVREAIKALPHPQREAIVLAYFGGLTQKEIAERLEEPLGTVKTRTRAALQQLRRALAGGGLMGEAL
ncbi:MAG TPA: sigma-70 family RNA polymerase sigma factor [Chloroflexia bacterium]|nr:sigma-70 family RNA polymerase sigma factor [Chloroflexia bacterium]